MFLSHKFLRYGKPLAAAAPIILALTGLPSGAHACTGDPATDPPLCANDGRTVNGFGEFYNSNLVGVPGGPGVPGGRAPGDALNGILEGFSGLGGGGIIIPADPTPPVGGPDEATFGALLDEPNVDFGFGGSADNGLTFDGVADNGLEFEGRIRFNDFDGLPNTVTGEPNLSISGRVDERAYFNSFLGGYGDGGTDAADIDSGETRFIRTRLVADNGIRFSAEIQVESGSGSIEEYNAVISGSFGSIRVGAEDGGDRGFSLGAGDDFAPGGIFRPQITLDNGLTIGVDVESGLGAAGGIPEGSDKPDVKYFTPNFAGYQLGVNYDTNRPDTGIDNLDGGREFDIRNTYVDSFGNLNTALSARWGVDNAATNFAVGQSSVAGYGEIEGIGIKSFGYVPLDDFGLRVDYNLDGTVTTTSTTTGSPGGTAPAPVASTPPPAPVTGTQVGTMGFANQGQRSEVNLIRTEDGKIHAVDKETGHDFGTVHESRSGFGWSFDNPPVPAPAPTQPAAADPIATLDQETIFRDGFESGDTSAWVHSGPSF
tara:strand:- start:87654 stop:89276 length:1623 start_codon:yes stop_codon:yes gene_type:complete